MENVEEAREKKSLNKAKSCISGQTLKFTSDESFPGKRKSFSINEAVRSVDMALGRLKKSKLVEEYSPNTAHTSPVRHNFSSAHMFMDSLTEPNYNRGVDSTSMMSMNFSHYELMRNLSRSNCNLEGAFSSSTCNAYSPSDVMSKNEHLERYFRSAERWTKDCASYEPSTSTTKLELSDK